MHLINSFVPAFASYCSELFFPVLIGFLLSGFLNEVIPSRWVEKYLGEKGGLSILISSFIGVLLPVCCFGSLPIAMTLRKKGARLGPVLAFLVTTPATSVSALIVCWKLLGWVFTIYIFFAVIMMGLLMGVIGNCFTFDSPAGCDASDECPHCREGAEKKKRSAGQLVADILRYGFITLPKQIGLELLLGIAVASFILVFTPLQTWIARHFQGLAGYLIILLVGLTTYVCSTASVPLADALIRGGLHVGQGMTYLLVGPITSYATIFVMKKEFGWKILVAYLLLISVMSVGFGIGFERFARF